MSQLSTSVKSRVQGFQISRALSTNKDIPFPSCSNSIWNLNSVSLTRVTVGREDSGWPCPPPSTLTPTADSQWAVGLMTLKGGSLHFNQILSSAFCLRFDILVTELRLYYET